MKIKKHPIAATLAVLGTLALAHTGMYAFTGLSFVAPSGESSQMVPREVLVIILHLVAIVAGAFGLGYMSDNDW